jgi:NADH-ubiquinone oxidoreductase chain 1
MTEHSASIFVFFFLGEYSSLILMSAFMSIFFLGGYHCPNLHNMVLDPFLYLYYYFMGSDISIALEKVNNLSTGNYNSLISLNDIQVNNYSYLESNYVTQIMESCSRELRFYQFMSLLIDKIYGSYIFGLKIVIIVFFFIWVRASFPRLRYDQLMSLC